MKFGKTFRIHCRFSCAKRNIKETNAIFSVWILVLAITTVATANGFLCCRYSVKQKINTQNHTHTHIWANEWGAEVLDIPDSYHHHHHRPSPLLLLSSIWRLARQGWYRSAAVPVAHRGGVGGGSRIKLNILFPMPSLLIGLSHINSWACACVWRTASQCRIDAAKTHKKPKIRNRISSGLIQKRSWVFFWSAGLYLKYKI